MRQVACERPDGTVNVHFDSSTCDVCANLPTRKPNASTLKALLQRWRRKAVLGREFGNEYSDPYACGHADALGSCADDLAALLSAEDAPPDDPGTLTVTYGARSFTVSHVSRATYDAVCTVLHGREIQDPRPPGETDTRHDGQTIPPVRRADTASGRLVAVDGLARRGGARVVAAMKERPPNNTWLSGVSAEQYIAAEEATDRLLTRARRWPHWHERERRIAAILETHPTYKRGAPTILLLFKAYRLAGQGLSWQAGRR